MGNGNTTEQKRHYKLYKAGTKWLSAAIISFGAGLVVFGGTTASTTHAASSDRIATVATSAERTAALSNQTAAATKAKNATASTQAPANKATGTSTDSGTAVSDNTTDGDTGAVTQSAPSNLKPDDPSGDPTQPDNGDPDSDDGDIDWLHIDWDSVLNGGSPSGDNTNTGGNDDGNPTTDPGDTPQGTDTPATTADGPLNQDTLTKGNVTALWDEGYQGQGMVVAVIDSGVHPHPDLKLSDDSSAAISQSAAESAIAKLGYGTYINSKIPFAYDYTNNDSTPAGTTQGTSTHGEHVAGIIAANGSADDDVSGDGDLADYTKGVAPEAQILAMQVIDEFADENTNDISRAIRDAVSLGANVIQMSLGIGVAEQDLTDEEQAAVKYATDHGVFVSISASNNSDAASTYNPATEYLDNVYTSYLPKNDSTIADPGASASAMTVAAETSDLGTDSAMASFSSWGPMVDYTLKPDISAPGVNVFSTTVDPTTGATGYEAMSGTSMAGPFDAGAAVLVMEKLKTTRPDLSGSDLVKAVKLALMNAAAPMMDANTATDDTPATDYVSPRRQGAGQINVAKAANLTVQAEGTNDAGSVSLHTIGATTKFNVTLTNFGDSDQTYTFSDDGGPETQVRDASMLIHDTHLAGASLTTDNPTFTLAAGTTKTVTLTLVLGDSVAPDQIVEGYFTFVATDSTQTITMPYLGYFGDLTNEQVIDTSANKAGSVFEGGYLVDNNNNVLGIADPVALAKLVAANADGGTTWTTLGAKVIDGKVAFSPNNDGISDTVYPYVFAKQSLEQVAVEILDANGNVVRTVDLENNTTKSYHPDGADYNADLGLSTTMRLDPDAFVWDGKIYDQATGQMEQAPDGEYTYRIVSKQYNGGSGQQQNYDLPVAVDTVAPTLTNLAYANGTVSFDYTDAGAGFTQYSLISLTLSGHQYNIAFSNDPAAKSGTITIPLSADQQSALANGDGTLSVMMTDVAGNSTTINLQAAAGTGQSTDAIDTTNVTAPQIRWLLSPGIANMQNADGSYIVVSGEADATIEAKVPAGVVYDVTATDAQTGRVYAGDLDPTTGIVTFHVHVSAGDYGSTDFIGTAKLNLGYGEELTTDDTDPANMFSVMYYPGLGYPAYTTSADATVQPFADNATVLAQEQAGAKGAPVLPGREFGNITTHAQPTDGLTFDNFNGNSFTLIGADKLKDIYDTATGELTITGTLADAANKTMIVTSATEPAKTVAVDANGHFSFTIPFKQAEQQAVGYRIDTTAADGTTSSTYGELQIYLDNIFPTLAMPQADYLSVDSDGDYNITTASNTFTVAGTVNDNINGYRLYANGSDLVHQKNLAGFNNHEDPTATTSNPYGAEDFKQTYDLTMGDNYFTVSAVDMVGNTVTKVFHVRREDGQVGRNDTIANGLQDGTVVMTKAESAEPVFTLTDPIQLGQVGRNDTIENGLQDGTVVMTEAESADPVYTLTDPTQLGQVGRNDTIKNALFDGTVTMTEAEAAEPVSVSAQAYYDNTQAIDSISTGKAPAKSNDSLIGTPVSATLKTFGEAKAQQLKTQAEARAAAASPTSTVYPATGEANSPLDVIGITLMSLVGLAGFTMKKKQH